MMVRERERWVAGNRLPIKLVEIQWFCRCLSERMSQRSGMFHFCSSLCRIAVSWLMALVRWNRKSFVDFYIFSLELRAVLPSANTYTHERIRKAAKELQGTKRVAKKKMWRRKEEPPMPISSFYARDFTLFNRDL